MKRTRRPIPRDILDVARETLNNPDPVTAFGYLLDAALRSLHPLLHDNPGRVEALNRALDTIYAELDGTPSGLPGVTVPAAQAERAGGSRAPRPALKP